MTSQEQQVLTEFLHQLVQVRGVAKDPQAQAQIDAAVARQPDAAYLLVQRALLAQQALQAAQVEIAALKNQLQSQQPAGGAPFLDPANQWGRSAASFPAPRGYPAAGATYSSGGDEPPMSRARGGLFGGGGGSFLGSAAAAAAGVVGGAFLFQGIEHMLGQDRPAQHGLLDTPAPDAGNAQAGQTNELASEAGIDDVGLDGAGLNDPGLGDAAFDDPGQDAADFGGDGSDSI